MNPEVKPSSRTRKAYVSPTIEQVELRPEEAVFGSCKSATTSGPSASTCTTLNCMAAGS